MPTSLSDFQGDARRCIESFQASLSAAIDSVTPRSGRRLTDLAEIMEIDTKLAWKLTRIVELSDPFSAGLYIPGAAGYKILRQAAMKRGVTQSEIESLDRAYRGFESLQRAHAGDRRTLDMLLSGLVEEEQGRRDIEQRKAAFHANSSMWGVRASMRLMSFFVHPSASDPTRIDVAHLTGLFGVNRTRPNVPWRVAQLRSQDNTGRSAAVQRARPIDPGAPPEGPAMLLDHCSATLPRLCPVRLPDGRTEFRLGEGPVGLRSEFDLVVAEFMPDAGGRYRAPDDLYLSVTSRNRTPAERLVLDLIVHRDLYPELELEAMLVSELWGDRDTIDRDDPERLPLIDRVVRVGAGMSAFHHRHIPRHAELMGRVLGVCGWDPDGFETYRLEMQYPPSPTALRMFAPLPEAP